MLNAKFGCKFLAFLSFLPLKTQKITISTSVWSAQHPKAGQNIQHPLHTPIFLCKSFCSQIILLFIKFQHMFNASLNFLFSSLLCTTNCCDLNISNCVNCLQGWILSHFKLIFESDLKIILILVWKGALKGKNENKEFVIM